MLTVLIRHKSGDRVIREVLVSAKNVEFIPDESPAGGKLLVNHGVEAEGGFCLSSSDDGDDWRDVFIMNAQGQTVARYTL